MLLFILHINLIACIAPILERCMEAIFTATVYISFKHVELYDVSIQYIDLYGLAQYIGVLCLLRGSPTEVHYGS